MRWISKIPYNELEFSVSRSRGPGGQNVNKTNSAVQLRFNPATSSAFTDRERERILEKIQSKLTEGGEMIIHSEESRDQAMNKKRCLEKLDELLENSYFRHATRRATKPTRSSQRKRVTSKRIRSEVKQGRGRVRGGDHE